MSQNLREINRLKHIIEEKDREIEMLKENAEPREGMVTMVPDERLSNRVNELEGMVKGLTEELLDMKAEVRKLSKMVEGASAASKPGPAVPRARAVPEGAKPVQKSAAETKPVRRSEDAVKIMQPDGTLEYEDRKSDEDLIVAGARPRAVTPSRSGREKRSAEASKPLIYAEEDDSVEIKKK